MKASSFDRNHVISSMIARCMFGIGRETNWALKIIRSMMERSHWYTFDDAALDEDFKHWRMKASKAKVKEAKQRCTFQLGGEIDHKHSKIRLKQRNSIDAKSSKISVPIDSVHRNFIFGSRCQVHEKEIFAKTMHSFESKSLESMLTEHKVSKGWNVEDLLYRLHEFLSLWCSS